MWQKVISALTGGQVSEAGIQWLVGAIAFLGILGIVLGVYLQIRKIKSESATAIREREDRIKLEAVAELERTKTTLRREIETETALRDMKGSIDRLNESFQALGRGMEQRVERLETDHQKACNQIATVVQATKSAHKRMDEHRRIEHNLSNHQYHEVEEITNGTDKEGWLG